jgi:cell division protein FtsB
MSTSSVSSNNGSDSSSNATTTITKKVAPAKTKEIKKKVVEPKLPILKAKAALEGKKPEFYDTDGRGYYKRVGKSDFFATRINKYSNASTDCTEMTKGVMEDLGRKTPFTKENAIVVYDVSFGKDDHAPKKGDSITLSSKSSKTKYAAITLPDEKVAATGEVLCSSFNQHYDGKASSVGWVVLRTKAANILHARDLRETAAEGVKKAAKSVANNAKLKKLTKQREQLDKDIATLVKGGAVIEPTKPKVPKKAKAKASDESKRSVKKLKVETKVVVTPPASEEEEKSASSDDDDDEPAPKKKKTATKTVKMDVEEEEENTPVSSPAVTPPSSPEGKSDSD